MSRILVLCILSFLLVACNHEYKSGHMYCIDGSVSEPKVILYAESDTMNYVVIQEVAIQLSGHFTKPIVLGIPKDTCDFVNDAGTIILDITML